VGASPTVLPPLLPAFLGSSEGSERERVMSNWPGIDWNEWVDDILAFFEWLLGREHD
jgi:hypothetical protein